jgi:voltage-gated potassium channel
MLYGTLGYLLLEGWSLTDALYMTVTTLATVGYGEVRPLDPSGKVFTISLIVLGVVALAASIDAVAGALVSGELQAAIRRRRMRKRLDHLQDHYVVCAYGRVGRAVCAQLRSEHATFVVGERLDSLSPDMRADGVLHLTADPTSEQTLRRLGVGRARALISCVDSDADNVFITLTARALNPKVFIVARASEPTAASLLYRAGADRVVSPYVSSGRQMALLATRPRVVDYIELTGPDHRAPLRLEELVIEDDSPLAGQPIRVACGRATPLALRRATGEIAAPPAGDEVLGAGDLVVLLGEPVELRAAEGDGAR